MSSAQLVLLATLVTYKVILVGIGLWASRRTHDTTDFYLGGRRLGPWVAAISASASSSSAWTLLGVSSAAYLWGFSALWLFPATVSGFLINWLWVAPRLQRMGHATGAVTLTEFVAGPPGPWRTVIARTGAVIVLVSFLFYVASQMQAAGNAFVLNFDLPLAGSIVIGGGIVMVYTLLGGFWAVSVTDMLQGLVMAATAIILPVAAFVAVGGWQELVEGWARLGSPAQLSLTGGHTGLAAVGFVAGTLGIGLGYPGQPHVVNRFMALRDETALRRGRVIAIVWALVVYAGMLLLGLCARVLIEVSDGEQAFYAAANTLLHPVVAGVMVAAVLSAIMSTADSQLLVAASAVSYDWRLGREQSTHSVWLARVVVLVLSVLAMLVALFVQETIFRRVLFAWHAVGSAFGPLVFMRLAGFGVRPGAALATLVTGFTLTVVAYLAKDAPGDVLERLGPLCVAMVIAVAGREPRSYDTGSAGH